MPIEAIASQTQSQSGQSLNKLADNFDTFLLLLTTQLKNQDPLEPLDSNQFTEQLVQFTGVEQSIATNKNLEQLVALSSTAAANAAVSYLGQEVTATGITAQLSDGSARWSYDLPAAATGTTLTVTDQNGDVIYTGQGETAAGQHFFDWNGRSTNGAPMPNGLYNMKVNAVDGYGNPLTVRTNITGIVDAASFEGTSPVLSVNGMTVRLEDVLSIRNQTAPGA